jgi:hypothetical protein
MEDVTLGELGKGYMGTLGPIFVLSCKSEIISK